MKTSKKMQKKQFQIKNIRCVLQPKNTFNTAPKNHDFKCSDCRNKYPHIMVSTDDVAICRWCGGEESENEEAKESAMEGANEAERQLLKYVSVVVPNARNRAKLMSLINEVIAREIDVESWNNE